jgi:hypothetical protein
MGITFIGSLNVITNFFCAWLLRFFAGIIVYVLSAIMMLFTEKYFAIAALGIFDNQRMII